MFTNLTEGTVVKVKSKHMQTSWQGTIYDSTATTTGGRRYYIVPDADAPFYFPSSPNVQTVSVYDSDIIAIINDPFAEARNQAHAAILQFANA